MSFILSLVLLAIMINGGAFDGIAPQYQSICECLIICGGLAGMGGGKHE